MHRVVVLRQRVAAGPGPGPPPTVTVRLVGELDGRASARLSVVLADACDAGVETLEVDLREVTSLDASSLAVLRQAHREAEGRGVAFRVLGAARAVGRQLLWAEVGHALPLDARAATAPAGPLT